ncbi:hypothetical protein K435DRAFT_860031 [Dendrothele bispora CBS 962.96]|uniref:Uncharacterized protein n=1 Tax=Dendrothele bispora (strain CBS 962.96) TaxID=1314807 RepID=A0A4S8LYX6_DENBC|nr:hypothetical protein K435DRAFT_860031 [Dendrothele bispora CBS 962.96]
MVPRDHSSSVRTSLSVGHRCGPVWKGIDEAEVGHRCAAGFLTTTENEAARVFAESSVFEPQMGWHVILTQPPAGVDPLSSYWFNGLVPHPVQIDDQDEGRGSKQADDGVDIRVKVMAEKLDLIERGYSLQLRSPTSEVNKVIFFEDLCDLVRPLHDHNFELHRRTKTYAATMPSKLPLYFHPPVLTGTLPTLHCLKTKHLLHTP